VMNCHTSEINETIVKLYMIFFFTIVMQDMCRKITLIMLKGRRLSTLRIPHIIYNAVGLLDAPKDSVIDGGIICKHTCICLIFYMVKV
jgi:hypothetical protein